MGSVMKRCACETRRDSKGRRLACSKKHGSWFYVTDIADPGSGRRRQRKRGGFATRADAYAAMVELEQRAKAGRLRDDRRQTVSVYLDAWLAAKHLTCKPTTLRDYTRHVQLHLVPRLGALRLDALRTSHVSDLMRGLSSEGRGVTTIRRIHATLSSALGDAVRDELIEINPARNAWLPTRHKTKISPWEPQEIADFFSFISGDPYAPIFELAVLTGLRRGELLGLRWTEVRILNGYLEVRQQIVQRDGEDIPCASCGGSHRGLGLSTPKTSSGDARRVPLSAAAAGLLETQRVLQSAHISIWGEAYADHGLVFAREDGAPIHPERLTKRFSALVKESGVRRVRLHDLRHANASLLLASGADLAVVSKLMGHSSYSLTVDTYSHLVAGVGHRAMDAASDLIPRSRVTSL